MMNSENSHIQFDNSVSLELVIRGGEFLGIGEVRVGDCLIRSGERPMFVDIRTPDGVELSNYRLTKQGASGDGVLLEFACDVRAGGAMEWMVHEVRPRINTANWSRGPQNAAGTTLQLELKPITRRLGDAEYVGFSYQYRYQSEQHPIYRILDRGTWEPGGAAVGNEFWMRNCFVPAITRFQSAEEFYSTEWYIPDCANPSAFQFLPLQTELQGFTFTANESGVLFTWPSEVAHVRSLFEKHRGDDVIAHWHEHCGDLGSEFSTSPVEVLFARGGLDRPTLFNTYEALREFVHSSLHEQIGMRRERVTTYGQIEEWGPADMDRYREAALPKLLEAGAKTVYMANHFQNNMNTYGVSNFCCTVDYKVAEEVGADKLKALCDGAKDSGARIEMWGNTSLSALSFILANRDGEDGNAEAGRIRFLPQEGSAMRAFKNVQDAFVRNPSNAIEADHYTPLFCVLNLRSPEVRNYWLSHWKAAHDEVGLGGIFLDSSFNLSSDKFHWVQNAGDGNAQGATADQTHLLGKFRPAVAAPSQILSQYHAHLSLMAEMQELGYVYCNEDLGVFGIHRHGPGIASRLDSLPLWSECIAEFEPEAIEKAGGNLDDVFFRGLAYRNMWFLHWNPAGDALTFRHGGIRSEKDVPTSWHLGLLRVFNEVNSKMVNRTILPDETGVVYTAGDEQIVWAFADFQLPVKSASLVEDVASGEQNNNTETCCLQRHRVYRIIPSESRRSGPL